MMELKKLCNNCTKVLKLKILHQSSTSMIIKRSKRFQKVP